MRKLWVLLTGLVVLASDVLAQNGTDSPQYECSGETMTIKGHVVKSSDIQPSKCPSNQTSKINVFVVSTFDVDSNLTLDGYEELNIFTDKWKVREPTTFNLRGFAGGEQAPPETDGTGGEPGNAGKKAGNFFGLSTKIVNGFLLTVNLNGGKGGTGQNGTRSQDFIARFGETSADEWAWPTMSHSNEIVIDYLENLEYVVEEIAYVLDAGIASIFLRILPADCCGKTGMGGKG